MKKDTKVYYNVGDSGGEFSVYEIETMRNGLDDLCVVERWSSADDRWEPPYKGKVAVEALDHGNGLTITLNETKTTKKRVIEIGYNEMAMLTCLLDYFRKNTVAGHEYKIQKTGEIEII